jgi:amino acid permease
VKNVVATYIGIALYLVLYIGFSIYQRFYLHEHHFIPLTSVDLDTDAVWPRGHGVILRRQEKGERSKLIEAGGWRAWWAKASDWW